MKRAILVALILSVHLPVAAVFRTPTPALAEETKVLAASQNNTLIESPTGEFSNGRGPSIFIGRTGQPAGSIRRGLLAFELAGVIPAGSKITSVKLSMNLRFGAGGDNPARVALRRVVAAWGEGSSSSGGGRGAPASEGDATWIHTFYPKKLWAHPGGDYASGESAAQVAGKPGLYEWSGPGMVADVRAWLASPEKDFGWILMGDESQGATAKVFDSRHPDKEGHAPQLTVTFIPSR
jgi:hypothetical protein